MSGLSHETLLGLDNVQVDLPIAPYPLRILAGLVDYVIFFVLAVLLMAGGIFVVTWIGYQSAWLFALLILGYFILEYGYFVALEVWLAGQTLGKKLFRLRVATRQGGRASTGAILVRNAFRSLDVVIGVPFMMFSPLGQRIGDRLAGTLVLETARERAEALVRRVPPAWGSREIGVAEEFLRRSLLMDPLRANELADQLLAAIERDSPGFLGPLLDRAPVQRLRDELGVTEA